MKLKVTAIRAIGITISLGVMSARGFAAPPIMEIQAGAQNQSATPAPISVLQVTGTTNSFTVSAQHADVLSLLKLVFDQSHRQFVPDAGVTGDVTFALSGQRFDTVLSAICRQTFLRYEVDKNGVYQFRRDEVGLRDLLLKTQAINNVLSDQLRRMGYAVPTPLPGTEEANRSRTMRGVPSGTTANGVQGGFGAKGDFGGGFGGGGGGASTNSIDSINGRGRGADAVNAPASVTNATSAGRRSGDSSKEARIGNSDAKVESARKPDNRGGVEGTQRPLAMNRQRGDSGPTGPSGRGGQATEAEASSLAAGLNRDAQLKGRVYAPSEPDLSDGGQYLTFKKQNSFVSVNTRGEKVPMQQVLADLSRQASVPILVDPDVPKGEEFLVDAAIPALPLNEMLNFLGYRARLEWRWVNGRIYVTATPQLKLYLRGSMLSDPANSGNIGNGITVLPRRAAAPTTQEPQKKPEDADKSKKEQKDKPN